MGLRHPVRACVHELQTLDATRTATHTATHTATDTATHTRRVDVKGIKEAGVPQHHALASTHLLSCFEK